MMFYGRYTRNEAICAFLSVATIYYLLRYLENGKPSHLFGVVVTLALNFTAKETAYHLYGANPDLSSHHCHPGYLQNGLDRRQAAQGDHPVQQRRRAAIDRSIWCCRSSCSKNLNTAVLSEQFIIPEMEIQTSNNILASLVLMYPLAASAAAHYPDPAGLNYFPIGSA